MSISRRNFLKGVGITAGAAAAYGITGGMAEAKVAVPKKWDMTYDVVIIGYGGAGAAAAITAHDEGAKVIILEKMHEGGGNTAVSAGGLYQPNDVSKGIKYVKKLFEYSHSDIDEKLIETYIKEASTIVNWVKKLKPGTELKIYGHAGFPQVEGAENADKWSVAANNNKNSGDNLWDVYSYAVEEARKIPVMLNTPAKRLITNNEGDVIGVIAIKDGNEINIKASRGVILTTGGYEYNEKMLKNFVKGYPIAAMGNPGNTGDGVIMAQDVGAELWHMNGASCPLGIRIPGYKSAPAWSFNAPGCIFVDKTGARFYNEKNIEIHSGLLAVDNFDAHAMMYPRIPVYAIFDDKARAEGGAAANFINCGYFRNRENGGYKWTRNNMAEIEKGWIVKADTIIELADKLKIEPHTLEKTVLRWNNDVEKGEDTQFNRPITNQSDPSKAAYLGDFVKTLSAPIVKGPFYAAELVPVIMNTQGGPRRNIRAQVMNPYGEPIKRLYSAGELGSLWGMVYQGAGNNAESVVFGRIAGANAAKEKAWK